MPEHIWKTDISLNGHYGIRSVESKQTRQNLFVFEYDSSKA